MKQIIVAFTLTVMLLFAGLAGAESTLILKNGRRITVESYREDGETIKFRGLGGEIGIPKDQIDSIQDPAAAGAPGYSVPTRTEPSANIPSDVTLKPNIGPKLVSDKPAAEQKVQDPRVKEEKEYQEKVKAITEKLKQLREQYARETRGSSGSEPNLFTSEEAFRGH